jgi:hypothetical protein
VLTAVSTSRVSSAAQSGSSVREALTHGFKGAFAVSAGLCIIAIVVAILLLPRRERRPEDAGLEARAMSVAGCPAHSGHRARLVALGLCSEAAHGWDL